MSSRITAPHLLIAALICLFADAGPIPPSVACAQQKECAMHPCFLTHDCLTEREMQQMISFSVSLRGAGQNDTMGLLGLVGSTFEEFIRDRVIGTEPSSTVTDVTHELTTDPYPVTRESNPPTTEAETEPLPTTTDSEVLPTTADLNPPTTAADNEPLPTTTDPEDLPTTADSNPPPTATDFGSNSRVKTTENFDLGSTIVETGPPQDEILLNSTPINTYMRQRKSTRGIIRGADTPIGASPHVVPWRARIFFVHEKQQLGFDDGLFTIGVVSYQGDEVIPRERLPLQELNQLLKEAVRRQFPEASIEISFNDGLSWHDVLLRLGLAVAVLTILTILIVVGNHWRKRVGINKLRKEEEALEMLWMPSPPDSIGFDPVPMFHETRV